eukprot:7565467-Lingulodinium_polyedra.AAC.1
MCVSRHSLLARGGPTGVSARSSHSIRRKGQLWLAGRADCPGASSGGGDLGPMSWGEVCCGVSAK